MFSETKRTIRAKNIQPGITKEDVQEFAEGLCKSPGSHRGAMQLFSRQRSSDGGNTIIVSLAPQGEKQTASITLPSDADKNRAIREKSPYNWVVDDNFNGLTIFHEGQKTGVDICAVHGLGGNGFETWAWKGAAMWLRDFLPMHETLQDARTMSFGYSSHIRDGSNLSGVPEWASGLLNEVSRARSTPEDRARPIIFVAHSLGGLVVREAMIELHRNPEYYPGLQLRQCGILFLATPHSGVTVLDRDSNIVQLTQLVGCRSKDFAMILEAFNNMSRVAKRDFAQLPYQVPYECFHETKKTEIKWDQRRLIVPADTAGLNAVAAQAMQDVDHREICRFPHNSHCGYGQITDCLMRIKERIETGLSANNDGGIPKGVRSGVGIGGKVSGKKEGYLKVSGGTGTGASMTWDDLKELDGRDFDFYGGVGYGAKLG